MARKNDVARHRFQPFSKHEFPKYDVARQRIAVARHHFYLDYIFSQLSQFSKSSISLMMTYANVEVLILHEDLDIFLFIITFF